jgi:hypothetical protein
MDFTKMSDKEILTAYYKYIAPATFNFTLAGLCVGELTTKRGYMLIEEDDMEDRFIKKEKKVA